MSEGVQSNVPSLRFPEFSGEWAEDKFEGYLKSRSTRGHQIYSSEISSSGSTPVVDQGPDLIAGYCESDDKKVKDVPLIVFGDHTTNLKFVDFDFVVGADGTKLLKAVAGNIRFHYFNLQRNMIPQEGYKRHFSILSSLRLSAPAAIEQQKIAEFLGAVDARAGLLGRRREALRAYKQGMMQRLFSRELRFTKPDGSPFPDWQEKRLGDEARFMRGSNLAKGDLDKLGQFPAIHYGELFTEYNEIIFEIRSKTDRSDCTLSVVGDVLMPSSDVTPDGLARGSALHIGAVMLGGDINIIRPSRSIVSNFLSYWIAEHKRIFMRLVSGTTVKHLYNSDLKSVSIPLPHPEEQQKIADFLIALDAKIDAVTAQLNATQAFKKGLLQQMFV